MKGHPDYQCDKVEWAAEVCKQVGSPRMKILFDIYHVQIMEGDVITRIKQFQPYVGHYHIAGVPGRNEMDDNQELNIPAILRAIVATGYKGFVGQEFIPHRDPMQSLREAVRWPTCKRASGRALSGSRSRIGNRDVRRHVNPS